MKNMNDMKSTNIMKNTNNEKQFFKHANDGLFGPFNCGLRRR
jgi:hypothetical protein